MIRVMLIGVMMMVGRAFGQQQKPPVQSAMPITPDNIATICTTDGEKGCMDVMCAGRNIVEGCPNFPMAKWSDYIDDKGHYIAKLDDPDNKWRCKVVSIYPPYDGSKIAAFTVSCIDTTSNQPTTKEKP